MDAIKVQLNNPVLFNLTIPKCGVIISGDSGSWEPLVVQLIAASADEAHYRFALPDLNEALNKLLSEPKDIPIVAILNQDIFDTSLATGWFTVLEKSKHIYPVLIARCEDISELMFKGIPILEPECSKYELSFKQKVEYTPPNADELDFNNCICITDDDLVGYNYFEQIFNKVLYTRGASRILDLLQSLLISSKQDIVVISDLDLIYSIQSLIKSCNSSKKVYIITHNCTENMLGVLSPLVMDNYLKIYAGISQEDITHFLICFYDSTSLTPERFDAAMLFYQLKDAGIYLSESGDGNVENLSPDRLQITPDLIRKYVIAKLKPRGIAQLIADLRNGSLKKSITPTYQNIDITSYFKSET